ncbi:MAG: hypothetical protein KIT72_10935 [Polyangiaceae bacterium]|nr:hypothetical protein [Polyangiaceae bacterium]MCW5790925.1 hypothetical protein [Polyangiaceae bacterium]
MSFERWSVGLLVMALMSAWAAPAHSVGKPDDVVGPTDEVGDHAASAEPKAPSLRLGGYIQPGFVYQVDTPFNEDDHDGFEFANARLTGEGEQLIGEELVIGLTFGFDVATGSFDAKDVYGSVGLKSRLLTLDVGQMKQPFGLALMQSEAQLQLSSPAVTRDLAFGRDQGARLRSEIELDPLFIGLGVMFANGEGGFRARRNLDDEFTFTARAEVGLGRPSSSEADLDDSPLELTLGGSLGHTPSLGKGFGIDDVGLAETRYGVDARGRYRGLSARVELIAGSRAARDGEASEVTRRALLAQLGYVLPLPLVRPKLEPVARLSFIDLNRQRTGFEAGDPLVDLTETRRIELGVNVYLEGHRAKLQLAYRLVDLLEGPRTDSQGNPLIGDSFTVFAQLGWL